MNLCRVFKWCSVEEMMNLPNGFTHALFKEYTDTMKDEKKRQALEGEQMSDELEESMGR
jgi:hypothetical protein